MNKKHIAGTVLSIVITFGVLTAVFKGTCAEVKAESYDNGTAGEYISGDGQWLTGISENERYSYAHGYYYGFLTERERTVYDCLIEACETYSGSTEFPTVSWSQFWNAQNAVRADHPEYFWVHEGILAYQDGNGDVYKAENVVPDGAAADLAYMNGIADEVAACTEGMSEYDKYFYIYDYINRSTDYGTAEGVDDQSMTGVFLHHLAVCCGYSDAFKFLCDRAGLFCITVYGYCYKYDGTDGGRHVWNMVRVGGSYYWVDVTWGDSELERTDHSYTNPNYYTYLCATDETFLKRHIISYTMQSDDPGHFTVDFPECRDETYTAYSLMDLQFYSYEEAYTYIHASLRDNIPYLWMQFDSTYELDRAVAYLCDNGGLWDYVNEVGSGFYSYYYFFDNDFNTLIVEFA